MSNLFATLSLAAACMAATACYDGPFIPRRVDEAAQASLVPPPSELREISSGGENITVYPYTSVDLGRTPQDPINIVFRGAADPRQLRADLLSLDGDRTAFGFPNAFPFNCTWSDAYGDVQSGYNSSTGYTASVIQLQCGSYGPIRFHLRVFPAGKWTIANAHFEMVVPGTADHQVLNWEIAEQLVVADFARSGLLGAAPEHAASINQAPGFRTIPAALYNLLPAELKQIVGGPATSTSDVAIPNDGNTTILTLAGARAVVPTTNDETLTFQYGQAMPRPFCSTGPLDYVMVQGPITLKRTFTITGSGNVVATYMAAGEIDVTQINPITGETGATSTAAISDDAKLLFGDRQLNASFESSRVETRANSTGSSWVTRLQVGDRTNFTKTERCN
jgi:hypothetical protein